MRWEAGPPAARRGPQGRLCSRRWPGDRRARAKPATVAIFIPGDAHVDAVLGPGPTTFARRIDPLGTDFPIKFELAGRGVSAACVGMGGAAAARRGRRAASVRWAAGCITRALDAQSRDRPASAAAPADQKGARHHAGLAEDGVQVARMVVEPPVVWRGAAGCCRGPRRAAATLLGPELVLRDPQLLGHQHRPRRYRCPAPSRRIGMYQRRTPRVGGDAGGRDWARRPAAPPPRCRPRDGCSAVAPGLAHPLPRVKGSARQAEASARSPPAMTTRRGGDQASWNRTSQRRPPARQISCIGRGACLIAARIADRSRSGRYCRPSPRRCRRRSGCGVAASSAAADMIWPDWQ